MSRVGREKVVIIIRGIKIVRKFALERARQRCSEIYVA